MKDTSKTPIKDLCVKKAENFSFLSLESAISLDDMKIKFNIMLRQNFSELFRKIWNDHMKTAATAKWKSGSELTIPDIKTEIWEPAFTECQRLLDSLRERTIQLSVVYCYFKFEDHKKKMIQSLYAGVEKCMNNEVSDHDPRWITVAADLMDKYWSLRELAEVADGVLNLKGELGLTGDFTLIEILAKLVCSMSVIYTPLDHLFRHIQDVFLVYCTIMISNNAAVLTVQLNSLLHGFKSVFLLSTEANIFCLCQRRKSDL